MARNYIYLIKVEGKENTLYKIGFTHDLDARMKLYKTHNPLAQLVEFCRTNNTEHINAVEAALKQNLKKRFNRVNGLYEWFETPIGTELSLEDFPATKHHIIHRL